MKLTPPRDLRSFAFDRVLAFEPNTFDIDVLLPALYYRVVTGGAERQKVAADSTALDRYRERLQQHPTLDGFAGEERLLDRLLRTTAIAVKAKGERKLGEQIAGFTGHSLLTFKPGFPKEISHVRRVDALLYRMLREQFRGERELRQFFHKTFGTGVRLETTAQPGGEYDGSPVDTLTRLTIAYLDGFEPTTVRQRKPNDEAREPLPAVADRLVRDLRRYLRTYQERMPAEVLTHHLRALICAELFVYSLKLFYAVVALVERPTELPEAMQRTSGQDPVPSPPAIYLDFTGRGLSLEMSRMGVRRDLELIQRFITANLTLKHLDRYIHGLSKNRRMPAALGELVAQDEGGPVYLQGLLALLQDQTVLMEVDASARHDKARIIAESAGEKAEHESGEVEAVQAEYDRIAASGRSDFERLVLVLAETLRTSAGKNLGGWYSSIGGLTKPYGLLSGAVNQRQGWRYAPGNDLLAVLVQLAAVDIPAWNGDAPRPAPIGLPDFLGWLEERFGMLVDRPPDGYRGVEYVAAAQQNLRALLGRLRQMGIFRDLSDDFSVQRLTPPYHEPAEAQR